MSLRYKGGVISATPPTPTSSAATGVWTLEQQLQAEAAGNWPSQIYFGEAMRSLRFNSADSAYLNRTPGSAGNRKTWTWSGWVKRSAFANINSIFECRTGTSDNTIFGIQFGEFSTSNDYIAIVQYSQYLVKTNAVFRDPSAWYHIVIALDTTQATASDRIKVYVNGVSQSFAVANYPSQNADLGINQAAAHNIGNSNSVYLNGYMTEVVFVDGQALTPSSFGQTNSTTGVWEPKAITGLTYGTNGFYLNFQDNSGTTATTLGKDSSGNGNNWTPNNFSVTAGAGNDSLVDTPTPYGTDTGAGGEVRGNYCTLNPLDQAGTLANGNLYISTTAAAWTQARGTIGVSSGKWYWETTCNGGTNWMTGIAKSTGGSTYVGANADGWAYSGADSGAGTGQKYNNGSATNYGATYTTNDIIGVALDMDAGTLTFYKNGVSQGQLTSGLSGTWFPAVCVYASSGTSSWFVNFGQRPFAYTAPSGFKALCTQNLSTPTVVQGDDYFNTVLYTGNASTNAITGVGFQPDFVWMKNRASAYYHGLYDAVRGTGTSKSLYSNTTEAEGTNSTNQNLVSFDTDGFTLGSTSSTNAINTNAQNHVAWNWKANGAGSSNTAGTITSTVSANTTSGFSIVTYTGNGSSGATVGHGLGVAPSMVIVKNRSYGPAGWIVYHQALGATKYIILNSTNAAGTFNYWNDTAPTSTVFSLYPGSSDDVNNSSYNYVAYCFAPVAGYSAFGSYTGNGSTDGPFIYTGFRPAFVLWKIASGGTGSWWISDNKINTYNVNATSLLPNLTNGDYSYTTIDMLSNGFKCRNNNNDLNTSGYTYIYIAFAQNPFKYALAR